MRSSTSSPRGAMLPRYQKQGISSSKKIEKQNVTHTEFMAFIEPFHELVKEKNFEELRKQTAVKNFNLKKEIYSRLNEQLKERLCSSFIFAEHVEIGDAKFDTSMSLKKHIKPLNMFNSIFEKHNILENYRSPAYKAMLEEYEHQVAVNNTRRLVVADAIRRRIKFQAYFYAYDIIHSEMEELEKRMKIKKKKSHCEIENEIMSEYLRRIREFHETFGAPTQFSDNETNHDSILLRDCKEEEASDPSMKYFA